MEKAFEELKSLIGLNKLLILVATALMALFIDNHEYKSLSESLVNLKTKELSEEFWKNHSLENFKNNFFENFKILEKTIKIGEKI